MAEAFIELRPGTYLLGIWFCVNQERTSDALVAAYRPNGEEWRIVWRFRYYMDKKAHTSDDLKSFYGARARADQTEAEVEEKVRDLVTFILLGYPEVTEVLVRSDDPQKQADALRSMPFCHVREQKNVTPHAQPGLN